MDYVRITCIVVWWICLGLC